MHSVHWRPRAVHCTSPRCSWLCMPAQSTCREELCQGRQEIAGGSIATCAAVQVRVRHLQGETVSEQTGASRAMTPCCWCQHMPGYLLEEAASGQVAHDRHSIRMLRAVYASADYLQGQH